MNIVGVSADYHDAAAALVMRGQVVAAAAEERFSRVRHDASFPESAIAACLECASLAPEDIDLVAYYEEPETKFSRVLASMVARFPRSGGLFADAMQRWLREKLWMRERLARHFRVPSDRVVAFPHHTSHAAQAFFPSPFADAAIITLDAVGEWTCSAIAHGDRARREQPLRLLHALEYPHSLGLFYSAFTQFLSFQPNSDECSTMALATFGQPRYVDDVLEVLTLTDDGCYRLDDSYLNLLNAKAPFTKKFERRFGEPRDSSRPWPFDIYAPRTNVDARSQYYADLAASVQTVLERAVVGFASRARALTESENLCFSGGVALNCVANAQLLEAGLFADVYIPPDPGDGGAALGAALYAAAMQREPDLAAVPGPYLGRQNAPWAWNELLSELQRRAADDGLPLFRWRRLVDRDERFERIAGALARGAICGWHTDRAEFGPRALGNRSILASAGDVAVARRLSARIKRRASFRPYALAVTEAYARQAFEFAKGVHRCARWMQTVVRAKPEYADGLRGGLHIDGTTRIQVCGEQDNPALYAILKCYGKSSNAEALINTSLNLRGEPIVETALDSLSLFFRSELDALMLDEVWLEKVDAVEQAEERPSPARRQTVG